MSVVRKRSPVAIILRFADCDRLLSVSIPVLGLPDAWAAQIGAQEAASSASWRPDLLRLQTSDAEYRWTSGLFWNSVPSPSPRSSGWRRLRRRHGAARSRRDEESRRPHVLHDPGVAGVPGSAEDRDR